MTANLERGGVVGKEYALFHNYISLRSSPMTDSPENITLVSLTPRTRARCQAPSFGLLHQWVSTSLWPFIFYPTAVLVKRQHQRGSANPSHRPGIRFMWIFNTVQRILFLSPLLDVGGCPFIHPSDVQCGLEEDPRRESNCPRSRQWAIWTWSIPARALGRNGPPLLPPQAPVCIVSKGL